MSTDLLSDADAEPRFEPHDGEHVESIGRCKHGDAVAVEDRTAEDREAGQQGFDAFAEEDP